MPDNAPIRFTAPPTRHSRAGGNPDLSLVETVEEKRLPHPDILDSRLRGNDDNLSCLNRAA